MQLFRNLGLFLLSTVMLSAQGSGGVGGGGGTGGGAGGGNTGFSAAGAVSRENRLRSESLAAAGVDLGTGAFIHEARVMTVHGLQDVTFDIVSNSLLTQSRGTLGAGWGHPYEARIEDLQPTPFRDIALADVYWDAHRKNTFQVLPNGQDYEPLDISSRYDKLRRNSDDTWQLTLRDGSIYRFDADGRLTSMANKIRQKLELSYADGKLEKVREPSSQQEIRFFYHPDRDDLLQHIQDNADRIVYFEYDARDRLTAIRNPATLGPVQPQFAPTVLLDIPDNDPSGLSRVINISDDSRQAGLVMLSSLSISHPNPSELEVRLTSPAGTVVSFQTSKTDPDWSLGGTVTGMFEGDPLEGNWILRIIDSVPGNAGTLNAYGLRFTGPTYATRLTYNNEGQIIRITAPDGQAVATNHYDAQGRLVSQDDGVANNELAHFTYEERPGGGSITTYTDRVGAKEVYEHDGNYNIVRYTNALEHTTRFEYDADGNRIATTDPLERTTRFEYDANGNLTRLVDPLGIATTYEYDSNNNLTRITDPLGHSTSYQYTSNNNMRRVTDALSHQDTRTYGGNSEIRGNLLHDGAGMDYGYTNGQLTTATHPAEGSNAASGADYDEIGRLIETTDGDGFTRRFEYDERGKVIRTTNERGFSTRTEYDARGRKTRTINAEGGVTRLEYDGNDNVIALTDASGAVTRYEYDGEDRLVREVDPLGNVIAITYDAAGQVITETDPLGNTIRHEYDAAGNETAMFDSNGVRIESIQYDDRDLPIQITDALGSRVRMSYDDAERLARLTDANGQATQFDYDELDRQTTATDPLNRTAERSYMSDDVTDTLVDARGNDVEFRYDAANRLTSVEYPWGVTRIRYNSRDLPDRIQYPNNRRVEYEYDQAGQISEMEQSGGGSTNNFEYVYDRQDNLTTIREASGNKDLLLGFSYDEVGRVTKFTNHAGEQIGYVYDAAGNMTELIYPDGKRVSYEYDAAGRMVSVVDWDNRETTYSYDKNGLLTGVTFPNGTTRLMQYDAVGQIVRRRDLDRTGASIVEYSYSYDAAGRMLVEAGSTPRPAFTPRPAMMSYNASRDWIDTYNGQTITYDNGGNLTRGPLGDDDTMADFRYGPSGNLTQAGNYLYSYDAEDNLITMSGPSGQKRLTVNPMPGVSQVIVSVEGASTTRYVWGIGLIYADTGGDLQVHHYDYRGSTVALSNASGQVSGRVSYGPFGELGAREGNTDTLFLHSGLFGVITDDNGLQHMRYRWYSPNLKRFLTPDAVFGSIDSPGSLNLYSYAGNNPVMRNDPSGQFWNVIGGAIAGAVVGVAVQAVTDLVTGKKPQWEDYAAAAIGGAVGGAIAGACFGVCGPAAMAAMGAIGGAADGAGSVALGAALRGDEPDPREVITAGLVGFAFGGITGGVAGKAGKAARGVDPAIANLSKTPAKGILKTGPRAVRRAPGRVRFNKKVVDNAGAVTRLGKGRQLQPKPPAKFSLSTREASRLNSIQYGRVRSFSLLNKADPEVASRLVASVRSQGRPRLRARHRVDTAGRRALNQDTKGVFGEHRHAKNWENAMKRAGIELPNSPLQAQGSF